MRLLLAGGILAGPLFIVTDLVAATLLYPGYDITSQQVSELSAIGAPSRDAWMIMGYPYNLLTVAFAVGLWLVPTTRSYLKIAAGLILLFALNSFLWGYLAPMHMRGTQFTDSDTMHIVFAVSAVVLMLGFMSFGAIAVGSDFRTFSTVLAVVMLVAGGVVSTQIPAIAANQPTPWMGLVERISVYAPMVWMAVLAVNLLQQDDSQVPLVGRGSEQSSQ